MTSILRLLLLLFVIQADASTESLETFTFSSKPLSVTGVVRSMFGPSDIQSARIGTAHRHELLWLRGLKTIVSGSDIPSAMKNLCHTSISYHPQNNRKSRILAGMLEPSPQMLVLFPGVSHVRFPDGFGMPFLADERVEIGSMVFNRDPEMKPASLVVTDTIEYVAERNVKRTMHPLFLTQINQTLPAKGAAEAGGCSTNHGRDAQVAPAREGFGGEVDHWVVPPGHHVYRRKLGENGLALPFDSRVHYIHVHLHPYARSIELRDLTEHKTVFKSLAHLDKKGVNIERSDILSSTRGLPVYVDHDYEMTSVYDNTSGESVDAMAIMYLYVADQDLDQGFLARQHSNN
jgi:hypothetical protein